MFDLREFLVVILFYLSCCHIIGTGATQIIQQYHVLTGQTRQGHTLANDICKSRGWNLPIIHCEDEIEKLYQAIDAGGLYESWVGLTLPDNSGNLNDFRWSDGSAVTVSDWVLGEPDDPSGSKCVRVDIGKGWFTRPCHHQYQFLCQETLYITHGLTAVTEPTAPTSPLFDVFVRKPDNDPIGTPLAAMEIPSLVRCVATCLRNSCCDVISLLANGTCLLFPSVPFQSTLTPFGIVYQKTPADSVGITFH